MHNAYMYLYIFVCGDFSEFAMTMLASPFLSPPNPINLKSPKPLISVGPKFRIVAFSRSPDGVNRTRCECRNSDADSSQSFLPCPAIKAPTAPWMKKPLLVKPNEMLNLQKPITRKDSVSGGNGQRPRPDSDLTGKEGGGRGKLAMKKIFEGIEKLQEPWDLEETEKPAETFKFKFEQGDLFGNGDRLNDAEVERSWSEGKSEVDGFHIPLGEVLREVRLRKLPWQRDERVVIGRVKKESVVRATELSLDGILLERLRGEATKIRKWVKVKKAGVTQAVVDEVRFTWKNSDLALLKFDIPLCRNMHRAREIVEMKTGGLVVWRNKDFLAVYRGCNYGSDAEHFSSTCSNFVGDQEKLSSNMEKGSTISTAQVSLLANNPEGMIDAKQNKCESSSMASLYEREGDRLLDGLGPRFVDWWSHKPLPVDADLLPEHVPGFKMPFRRCPPFTRLKLTDDELTHLRKLARPLPTHFVLGRNRRLQGLAAAILKLWEKCHIAKIALKWGIPNTDNEQMAYELKILTGGVLLLRNKFLILLYRGKDFVPSQVAKAVSKREMELSMSQLQEEAARLKASETLSITEEHSLDPGVVGTLSEFHSIDSERGNLKKLKSGAETQLEAELERLEKELKDQEQKHFILKKKMEKSAKLLEKLNNGSRFSQQDSDAEIISREERECLREIGLKNDNSLELGRRGVYDGVIEGMHQHWKHREVVKVITKQQKFSQIMHTAKTLEAESGGILISVVKLKQGHAILLFRGKNYKRPMSGSYNLLNKREALSRSLEIQRHGSLKFFAKQREQAILDIKRKLAELLEKKSGLENNRLLLKMKTEMR